MSAPRCGTCNGTREAWPPFASSRRVPCSECAAAGRYVVSPFPVRPVVAGEPLAAWVKGRIRLHDQRLRWAVEEAIAAALFGWLP